MSHAEIEQQVALLDGGELGASEAAKVERHLAECEGCRQLAEELGDTRALLAELGAEEPDREVLAAVRESVLAATAPRRWPWVAAVAAALVLALAAGVLQQWRKAVEVPLPVAAIYPPEAPAVKHTPKPAPEPAIAVAARPDPVVEAESMVIKILTDDPEVVICWLVEGSD